MYTPQPATGGEIQQDVLVAHDHRSLGDDADGIVEVAHRFERSASQLVVPFDRLVAVGRGSDGDVFAGP